MKCPHCGTEIETAHPRAEAVPWVIAGASAAALFAVLLVRLTATAPAAPDVPAPQATTDIASMSPRERADRLFNRVMASAERGDSAQVAFFGSMAFQAYDLLGSLDADARYHLGLMRLVTGDTRAAIAQGDSIATRDPHHLFASLLRAEAATHAHDAVARDRAWRKFLTDYDSEMKTGKAEYADHRSTLQAARAEAGRDLGKEP